MQGQGGWPEVNLALTMPIRSSRQDGTGQVLLTEEYNTDRSTPYSRCESQTTLLVDALPRDEAQNKGVVVGGAHGLWLCTKYEVLCINPYNNLTYGQDNVRTYLLTYLLCGMLYEVVVVIGIISIGAAT
jgi:hypothetical protein